LKEPSLALSSSRTTLLQPRRKRWGCQARGACVTACHALARAARCQESSRSRALEARERGTGVAGLAGLALSFKSLVMLSFSQLGSRRQTASGSSRVPPVPNKGSTASDFRMAMLCCRCATLRPRHVKLQTPLLRQRHLKELKHRYTRSLSTDTPLASRMLVNRIAEQAKLVQT
jgi:hypothetical protein